GSEEEPQPDVPFELCYPNSIYVEVLKDFFGTGQLLMPSAFTLGGCTATGEDSSAQVLIFESELHGCGSTSLVTVNELVYTFSIIYTPKQASYGGPIVRSSGAVVGIECHCPRVHNVSSDALMPTWIPYATTLVAEEFLVFSLRLMTEFINIDASVRSYNHVPLRVFVDRCVATSVPDTSAIPRYSFIENNGCLVDAKLTGSRSRFMPRTQFDKLQFQMEAFRFQKEISGFVAAASTPTNVEQKACSFSANRWVSADEDDQVCGCCDTTCGIRSGSDPLLEGT
uniref:Zona pellucida sperm-binding protein 3 n=1 Tax=Sinocyclocheilus anshuiensis TaxID=1608454 RepID=A0A671RLD4_9TELE